jgi:outer membrane protein OmpA-like peptidoglycan-associated protein
MKLRVLITVLLSILTGFLPHEGVAQEDVPGSSDHPLVSRYAGSYIVKYDSREFDAYELLTGAVARQGPSSVASLEGKVTEISYRNPDARSTLEVLRNYEDELTAAGFEILFTCSNEDCGGRDFNHAVVAYQSGFAENYRDQRFIAARRTRPDGDLAVSLYVVRNTSEGGSRANQIFFQLDVIEGAAMETGMVDVDAETMAREISETGSISLYGIHFDTGKTDIKPESESTLAEIATLLRDNAGLSLFVVGHTDNVGALDYNRDLSRRRAAAVVAALVGGHGVDGARLQAEGVGPLSPVAPNESEEGRALNRRVELVRQ